MALGTRSTNLPAITDLAHVLAIDAGGSTGRLSSTALGTILAASGPIATALAAVTTGMSYVTGGPVACATTANITLSGEQTLDGVLTSTSRVLVKAQTDPAENGIWVSAAGAWTRATDMDAAAEVTRKLVSVTGGTVHGRDVWATYSTVTTLGTDAIEWVKVMDGDSTADLAAHEADTANPHSVTAAQVGLGNVDNTADADKPVSTATQTALDLKASLASPTFTGTLGIGDDVTSRVDLSASGIPEAAGYLMQMRDSAGEVGLSLDLNFRAYLRAMIANEVEAATFRQSDGYRFIYSGGDFLHQISDDGGVTWTTVMSVDRATGDTELPFGPSAGGGAITVAADIYVDSVAGDDGNAGTLAAPLATLAAAETALATTGSGTTIALKCGSTWRETLDTSAYDSVTVAAYGTASDGLPLIAGDDVLTGTWDTSTDRADAFTNVYTLAHTLVTPSDNSYPNLWEDGTRLVRVYSYADCQSTAGTFYVPETGSDAFLSGTSITIAVHPTGSTNPNSDGKVYEAMTRKDALALGDYSTARLIHARRAGHNSGPIYGGFGVTLDRCLAEDGYRHCALIKSGLQVDTIGWMQTYDSDAGQIVLEFYDGVIPTDKMTARYERCIAVVETVPAGDTTRYNFNGHGPSGVSNIYSLVEIVDCAAKNGGMTMGDTDAARIVRPYIEDGGIVAAGETTIIDPYINLSASTSVVLSGVLLQGNATSPLIVDGLRLYAPTDLPGAANTAIQRLTSGSTSAITLRNSVAYFGAGIDSGSAAYLLYLRANAALTIEDCIFDMSDAPIRGRFMYANDFTRAEVEAVYTGSGNAISPGDAELIFSDETTDVTTWLAANDTGSAVVADLSFADPANGDWTATGTGIPSGAGLLRPNVGYTSIPETLAAAKARLIAMA